MTTFFVVLKCTNCKNSCELYFARKTRYKKNPTKTCTWILKSETEKSGSRLYTGLLCLLHDKQYFQGSSNTVNIDSKESSDEL